MKTFILAPLFLALATTVAQEGVQDDESKCCCTTLDVSICLTKIHDKLDARLNATYREALTKTERFGSVDVQNLKEAQRKWVAYRDAACKAEYGLWQGGSGGPNAHAMCVIRMTKQRIADLENSYTKLDR